MDPSISHRNTMNYKGILYINGKKFMLRRDSNKVGSSGKCDIHLQHPSISKLHVRINWTIVGLVITNMTSSRKTFVNNVQLKPLETKAIKSTETSLKFGELEGFLVLHKKAREIARATMKELQQSSLHLQCRLCRRSRKIKIKATFDEERRFRLKFDVPRKHSMSENGSCMQNMTIDHSLYDNFSRLSLITETN